MGILITATNVRSGTVQKFWTPVSKYEAAKASFGEGWSISMEPCKRRPANALHINERI